MRELHIIHIKKEINFLMEIDNKQESTWRTTERFLYVSIDRKVYSTHLSASNSLIIIRNKPGHNSPLANRKINESTK